MVLARRDHPLATAAAPDLADLMESAWVLPRQGTPTREALGACLAQHGLPEPQVAVESSDISLIRGLLLETDMLSAASRQLFPHELRAGILVELPVVLAGTERSMGILRRTQEHSSPGAQLLIEAIRRVCRDESGAKDQRSAAARP